MRRRRFDGHPDAARVRAPEPCTCAHPREAHVSGFFNCTTPGCTCTRYRRDIAPTEQAQPARLPGGAH